MAIKPWEEPGAKPRYRKDGSANHPQHECGCPQHGCDGNHDVPDVSRSQTEKAFHLGTDAIYTDGN